MLSSIKIGISEPQSMNIKRQARKAVNQAVTESSETCDVMMMQEFQSILKRYEGRLEEHERTVAPVIGSEARGAPRGQRSHMIQKHQVLLHAGPDAVGFTVTQCKLSMNLTRSRSSTRANYTTLGIPGLPRMSFFQAES